MCRIRIQGVEHEIGTSHYLILRETSVNICVHAVEAVGNQVFDEAQSERPATILVTLKLGDGCVCRVCGIEADDAGATRTTTAFVLDLGLLDLSNGGEQFDEVLVTGGPGQLRAVLGREKTRMGCMEPYVADIDRLGSLGARSRVIRERVGGDR